MQQATDSKNFLGLNTVVNNQPNFFINSSTLATTNISNLNSQDNRNTLYKDYVNDQTIRFLIEFSAGAIGGAVSRTATAPIDRLKTVFQVQSVDMNKNDLNLKKLFLWMIKEGQLKGLWRGNLVNVVKTAPESAIRLATYEKLKQLLDKNKKDITFNEKLLCGSTAGFLATLILYPLKTVKTIMNLGNTGEFKSIYDCINKIYKAHGFKAFYKGLIANSLAIIPSAGIDLAMYETFKQNYSKFTNKTEPSVVEKIIIGNLSSCVGNFIVYPLLFARTRLQSNRNPNETTCNVLLHVWRKDGLLGVYRGFFLHILKIGPAASISYVTFEAVTKAFSIKSL